MNSMKTYSSQKRAFSLVEILVVLAIMSVLMGIGMKAFSGQGSQEFSKGLTQISGILELSHAQSTSTRSTIRLLIGLDDQDMIIVPLSCSDEAEASLTNTVEDSKAWSPTSKPIAIKNLHFSDEFVPEKEGFILLSEATPIDINRSVAGKEINFTTMIQFSPQGEVLIYGSEKSTRGIQFGVQSTGAKPQKAAIRISTLTGRVEILREENLTAATP